MLSVCAFAAWLFAAVVAVPATYPGFISARGTTFQRDGAPFTWRGANSYYLFYQDGGMVNDVFARTVANGFNVIRTWAWSDTGHPDGSDSVNGQQPPNGVYFQAFDPVTNSVVVNETNLERLDVVVAAAKAAGVSLVLTLTNNWEDFGGVDQYISWVQQVRGRGSTVEETPVHAVMRRTEETPVRTVMRRTGCAALIFSPPPPPPPLGSALTILLIPLPSR